MFWCQQYDMHNILATGKDLYKVAASAHFGVPADQVTKDQRSFGKLISLALGYGQGAEKFKHTCASGPLGMEPFHITSAEATHAVNSYRKLNHKVKETWGALEAVLAAMQHGEEIVTFRGLTIGKEYIKLPDGVKLIYPNLQCVEGEWSYGFAPKISKIYGAKLLENIIQATARAVIADQLTKIEDAGYKVVHSVHDEFLLVCHETLANQCLEDVKTIMSTTPSWIPGLVLSAEGDYANEYSK
jgi:DNA polymerase